MTKLPSSKLGFTLIELLIVIVIIALLVGILLPNMLGMRQRARDSKLKSELRELKLALEVYNEDNQGYPADDGAGGMDGCGMPLSVTTCIPGAIFEFDNIVYMPVLPDEYFYETTADGFQVSWELENQSDQDAQRSQDKCGVVAPSTPETYYECAM